MLGLVCNRNVTWLWDRSAFAGQEDPNFYFLLIMKLTRAREQHRSRSSCSPGWAVFPELSKQCQGGRADTSSKCLQRPSPGREGADSWAGLDIAWVFLGRCQEISSWHCWWPEEYKITIFSQESYPQGAVCSVIQRNISILLQTSRKESQRQPGCESHRNPLAHILYIVIWSTDE